MIFNPPLRHGDTTVISINEAAHIISFVIYVKAYSPLEVQTQEMQGRIKRSVDAMIHYLEWEDYIQSGSKWTARTGVVVTTP